jgi:hypothetical protein
MFWETTYLKIKMFTINKVYSLNFNEYGGFDDLLTVKVKRIKND